MAKKKLEPLVSPDGKREWLPEDAAQATNLRAQGWAPKPEDAAEDGVPEDGGASKPATKTAK